MDPLPINKEQSDFIIKLLSDFLVWFFLATVSIGIYGISRILKRIEDSENEFKAELKSHEADVKEISNKFEGALKQLAHDVSTIKGQKEATLETVIEIMTRIDNTLDSHIRTLKEHDNKIEKLEKLVQDNRPTIKCNLG